MPWRPDKTIPRATRLRDAIDAKAKKWADVVKIGRTHLEDATPLTVGQEWSGYAGALDDAIAHVTQATQGMLQLAMGGTAVGTGLNSPAGFGEDVAKTLARLTGDPLRHRHDTNSRRKARWIGWCGPMAPSRTLPSLCSRSPTTCAGWARAQGRGCMS